MVILVRPLPQPTGTHCWAYHGPATVNLTGTLGYGSSCNYKGTFLGCSPHFQCCTPAPVALCYALPRVIHIELRDCRGHVLGPCVDTTVGGF